jgi:glycine/D-amino acid oxidase-like deaminating enzyme
VRASPGHVVVVGGGVFGAAGALELRSRGWSVTLLDPHALLYHGASSTDVSKLVRMDYGSDVFYHELAEAALEGWDHWNATWPVPVFHEDGLLVLSRGPMSRAGSSTTAGGYSASGVTRPSASMPPRSRGASPPGARACSRTGTSTGAPAGSRAASWSSGWSSSHAPPG